MTIAGKCFSKCFIGDTPGLIHGWVFQLVIVGFGPGKSMEPKVMKALVKV